MIFIPILFLCLGALISAALKPKHAPVAGCITACVGCAAMPFFHALLSLKWSVPGYAGAIELFFMLPIAVLGIAAAVNSIGYLKGHGAERANFYWFFFNLMLAAMFAVVTVESPVLFLLAWETMGVASAALVAFNYKSPSSMRATWIYLVACHAGAAFLMLMFAARAAVVPSATAVFVFAILGFGLKAGFAGLHVWLPEAHPAAPAPISAIMSGAMINLGFLGIFKFGLVSIPPEVVGWTFLVLGIAGALLGIIFALPQKDLKRLLAFSSIENMGVIAIAAGLGFLGIANKLPAVSACGFTGAALHLINHSLLKGCLFFCAGAVLKSTDTLDMDLTGGLMKRMPKTGTLFALNSAAISGMPPLNGFVGEFFIYIAAFFGVMNGDGPLAAGCIGAAISLALVGGLAVAAFSKAIGATFLGEPRSECAVYATEAPRSMTHSAGTLFLLSLCSAFLAPLVLHRVFTGLEMYSFAGAFLNLFIAFAAMLLIAVIVLIVRFRLLPRSEDHIPGPTWDCGYAKPTARMAYTGTSFTQPLADLFSPLVHPVRRLVKPTGLFPEQASADLEAPDVGIRFLWRPVFSRFSGLARRIHPVQSGHLHAYILAMVSAMAAMLIWGMLAEAKQLTPSHTHDGHACAELHETGI